MRIKIDENLPASLTRAFADAGHDADTVADKGLLGADDPTVCSRATADRRMIVTLDRGFGDVRRYPPGTHAGILVLRLDDQSSRSAADAIDVLVRDHDLEALAGCVAVFRNGELRVRRPAP